jgi:cbb3-type cytochrome c oxidase subunit III
MACSDCGAGSLSSDRESDGPPEPEPDGGIEVQGMPSPQDAASGAADGAEADAGATAVDSGADVDVAEAACPRDLPAGCESPAPSWMNVVQPIVAERCNACHGVGGVEQAAFDFSTYEGVRKAFGSVLNNVYGCLMPPPDAGALTPEERQALLAWLVCSAPNN